jgi:hypothetical protein
VIESGEDPLIAGSVPKATLYQWRYVGIGPKAGRVGRHLRYDPADVIAWFRQQQEAA